MHILKNTDYQIYIGTDIYEELKQITESSSYTSVFLLIDENIRVHCMAHLNRNTSILSYAKIIEIESGEEMKNFTGLEKIWDALVERGADRNSLLINFGGGVIGDMGGLAATLYKRGIDFVQIPTSLLSMVDASIGGKTGVDYKNYKNLIGAFSNPKGVFIDSTYLSSLPEGHLKSGFAEILKACLLDDRAYWDVLKQNPVSDIGNWDNLVQLALMIKNEIVGDDPHEEGSRQILNFGHSFGHAFETFALERGRELHHGHAVALGIICELWMSEKKQGFKAEDRKEIEEYILANYQKFDIVEEDFEILYEIMIHDKKNLRGTIRLVLLQDIAKPLWGIEVGKKDIQEALKYYLSI